MTASDWVERQRTVTASAWPTCGSVCEFSYGGEDRVRLIDTAPGTVAEIRVPVRRRGDATLLDAEPESESDTGSLESTRTPASRARLVANQGGARVGA